MRTYCGLLASGELQECDALLVVSIRRAPPAASFTRTDAIGQPARICRILCHSV